MGCPGQKGDYPEGEVEGVGRALGGESHTRPVFETLSLLEDEVTRSMRGLLPPD